MIFKGNPGNEGFFQKRCTAPASAKAGPHIYKEGKEKHARGLPRTGKQEEGGPAPQEKDVGPAITEYTLM